MFNLNVVKPLDLTSGLQEIQEIEQQVARYHRELRPIQYVKPSTRQLA